MVYYAYARPPYLIGEAMSESDRKDVEACKNVIKGCHEIAAVSVSHAERERMQRVIEHNHRVIEKIERRSLGEA